MTGYKTEEVIRDSYCETHQVKCQEKRLIDSETKNVIFKRLLCDGCKSDHDMRVNDDEADMTVKRQANKQREIDKNLVNAMISPLFKDRTFDNYITENPLQEKYKKELAAFTPENNRCGYIMLGTTGSGKNHLASAVINNLVSQGYTGLFTTLIKMVRAIKDSWGNPEVSEQSIVDRFTDPDILVIDEMGVQFESVTEQNYLTEIINNRYEFMKPTILLGNLSDEEFKALVGDRVLDRFRETGKRLIFDWESYRGKKVGKEG